MRLKLFYLFAVVLIFLTVSIAQQFGGDNISYTGDGVTIWDFSRAVPAALACAAVVIVQALNISYFLLTFSKDPPKEKPKEEKPAPYGKEKPKEEKPKEEKAKEEPAKEVKNNYVSEEPPKTTTEAPKEVESNYVKPPTRHYFYRHRRSAEESNLLEMLRTTEHEECYSRLICTMATGDLIESRFDILPKFFLNPNSGFEAGEFGYHYTKAAQFGKLGRNAEDCEAKYKCPLSRNEFAKMILT